MSAQKKGFLGGEADRWFQRNGAGLGDHAVSDPVLRELTRLQLSPQRALEIGCSNGWRLGVLRERWGCAIAGVDPSAEATRTSSERWPDARFIQGTADALPFADVEFDLVVFGFCLYLCDRSHLFRIAAEADRVLADGGHLLVYDFQTAYPYRNPYTHHPGLFSYKMDYGSMFRWNPAYTELAMTRCAHDGSPYRGDVDDCVAVSTFQKAESGGYADGPPRR